MAHCILRHRRRRKPELLYYLAARRADVVRAQQLLWALLSDSGHVYVRPQGDTWLTAGPQWLAARALLRKGLVRVYGTKYGTFVGPWHYREILVCLPEDRSWDGIYPEVSK
jgi:hypothetical protein